jgi:hypothetical protein
MNKISLHQLGFFNQEDPYTLVQRWGTEEGLEAFIKKESINIWEKELTSVEMEESEFKSVEDPENPGLTKIDFSPISQ